MFVFKVVFFKERKKFKGVKSSCGDTQLFEYLYNCEVLCNVFVSIMMKMDGKYNV